MKKIFYLFLLFVTVIFWVASSEGAVSLDLSYICTSKSTLRYNFTVGLYRDCSEAAPPLTLTIHVSSISADYTTTFIARKKSSTGGTDLISHQVGLCSSETSTCTGGSNQGFDENIYEASFNLPRTADDWVISVTYSTRFPGITNLTDPSTQPLYAECHINNTSHVLDHSPIFTTFPIARACDGEDFFYSPGGTDQDGDSLAYRLAQPLGGAGLPIPYSSGSLTPQNPLKTRGGFEFGTSSGQMHFITDSAQVAVVSLVVISYRNGMIIDSIQRDILIITSKCSDHSPVIENGIENVVNGFQSRDSINKVRICPGALLSFDISGSDADARNHLTLITTLAEAIPGAAFTVSGTNPVTGHFSWTPQNEDIGVYPFTVTLRDDQCPYYAQQVYAFAVNVERNIADAGNDTSICINNPVAQLHGKGDEPYKWIPEKYLNDSTIADPVATLPGKGVYTFVFISEAGGACESRDTVLITVSDSLIASFQATPDSGCDSLQVSFINNSANATSFLWNFGDGTTSTAENPGVHVYRSGSYIVSLIVNNSNGCGIADTAVDTIRVNPSPLATFSGFPTAGCEPLTVTFISNAAPGDSLTWNFGDGSSGTGHNPVHVYDSAGVYSVIAIATNSFGCSDTSVLTDYINVSNGSGGAVIVATPVSGCAPLTVQFTGKPDGGTYVWDFGDGDSSTQQNPSHLYVKSGTYHVMLTVNDQGCPAYITIQVITPVASFTANPSSGCDPLDVSFINTSTEADSFIWLFGDGSQSTERNPTHTYRLGTYSVTLIAISSAGCSDTLTLDSYIKVTLPPSISISAADTSGCEPLMVHFSSGSNGQTFIWDFGDGASSTDQNPSHTYAAGNYSVILTAFNGGCSVTESISNYIHVKPGPVANFSAFPFQGCDSITAKFTDSSSNAASYLWLFGDGSSSSQRNPSHKYFDGSYNVTLIVTGINGCTDTLVKGNYIVVSPKPSVDIVASDTAGCEPLTVNFSNGTGSAGNYEWNFGDGTSSSSFNPTHIYAAGTYTVSLTVSNGADCSASQTIVNYIHVKPSPVANVSGTPLFGCAPLSVNFTNNSTGASSYFWNFGDGNTSTETTPSHLYIVAGIYDVTLIATNAQGCTSTLTLFQYINVTLLPVISFSADPTSGCAPLTVNFINASSGGNSYVWNFGDSSVSTGINPTHTYDLPGSYSVTLTVAAEGGCSVTQTFNQYITVLPSPTAAFGAAPTLACSPLTVNFTNNASGAFSFIWIFGDGDTSTEQNPTHTYNAGNFSVTLVASNSSCSDTLTLPDLIKADSFAVSFTASDSTGCDPLNVQFQNTTVNGASFLWDFGDGTSSSEENPTHLYHAGIFDVTLTVTSDTGCVGSSTRSQLIKVYTKPTPSFNTTEDVSIPIDISKATIHFNNTSQNATSYSWNFGDGNTSTETNPVHTYGSADTFFVTLTAYNGTCSDTFTLGPIIIVKQDDIFFPSAFTPNNDGKNDYFHEMIQVGIATLDLEVFDRWGNVVFQTNDPKGKWDGTYKGKAADIGVYVWYAKATLLNGKEVSKRGNISLLR